ncbi:hypothetical protein F4804DRAFT_142720 [Jackrogersella minutella]|nr:hypothetical protein F4804DRAFT_142720 [Jackrogersella minutella]
MSSSRNVPTPLNIRASSESSHSRQESFDSSYSDKDKESHGSSRFDDYRKALGSHSHSHSSPNRKSSGSTSKPHSPTVNVYTHCGRHTDQYLLGGWSNVVRSAFKKD